VIDRVLAYVRERNDEYLERLHEFLTFASISTDPSAERAMRSAAEWCRKLFAACGIEAEVIETAGHPAVTADTGPAPGGPTILIYGHYDVQPTGDLDLWNSEPFEPEVRDGRLYARGAADDKGQVLAHMLAAEAWKMAAGRTPLRIKFLIEGEEEIGSANLGPLIARNAERFACDYVCISDTAKFDANTPAITYGTKGLLYKEVVYTGPDHDLHSGSFGGTVTNPANALAALVAQMKDDANHVTIPGFYDDVLEPAPDELDAIARLPFDEQDYAQSLGVPALDGEQGFSTLQRRWLRPTLDVNGVLSGFVGEGASTIIPARAMAKVSMRLVSEQVPDKIGDAFDDFVRAHTPAGVHYEIRTHASAGPYSLPLDNPGLARAAAAVETAFGVKPAYIREGGTLPILPMFKKLLGAESIMIGLCVPNCNAHGPNEFFVLDDFYKGILMSVHLAAKMAAP
jgi:succinyl-diaminopimelate desuccinylase